MKRISAQVSSDSSKHTSSLELISDGRLVESLPIIGAKDEHRAYVLSTWVKSYEAMARKLLVHGMRCQAEGYRRGETSLAERLWAKARVVSSDGDDYAIHAWVCGERGRLYHVYVPPSLRGNGIAKALVEDTCGKEYSTHKPWPNKPKSHTVWYDPWIGV